MDSTRPRSKQEDQRSLHATDWFTRMMGKFGWRRHSAGSMSVADCPGLASSGTDPTLRAGGTQAHADHRRLVEIRPLSMRPIDRPLSPDAAAASFVPWCQEMGLTGERLWRDLWQLYVEWHCPDQGIVPLPDRMSAQFAQALGGLCQKGQARFYEDGRLRRLTTYEIADNLSEGVEEPVAFLRAA